MKLIKGLLLKPTLNLLERLLRRDGNSLIIGGPMGWNWQATLDETHHGVLAGPANAHRHSDLANVGIDDHHDRDHAARHQSGGADEIGLDAAQISTGRFGMSRMPDGTSGQVLTAQGAGVDPAYAAAPGVPSGLIAMWSGTIASIPSGWVICDGNNSTPNLLARFIRQVATAGTNPGSTGGADTVALTIAQLASHSHFLANTSGPGGSPHHDSYVLTRKIPNTLATNSVGSGSAHQNMPAYYSLAFIMKT